MRTINVNETINNARFGGFHWIVVVLCGLLLVVDGYDVFIYGTVLPKLMEQWKLTPPEAGSLASWALFGMMFGALIFGPLADKIGRKKGIAICFTLFTLATLVNGFAGSPFEFGVYRFLAGLGCGGLMPNAVALTNEYAPKRLRSTLVALMFSGYSVGGMVSAGLGIMILPSYGWQAMFFVAVVPLILLPLMWWKLPESVGFLMRQGHVEQARTILAKLDPGNVSPGDRLEYHETKTVAASVSELFRHQRSLRTLMLWVSFFCCLLMVYALGSWLPKLMNSAGFSLGSSLSFLLTLNFGGMLGAIAGGWLGDRFGLPRVVVVFFVAAALSIALLGQNSPMPVLYLLIFIAGATTIGTQILLYASVAQLYNLSVRSTGLGWASGVGRVGAIVGPMLGGLLLAAKLPLEMNFLAFAVPGAISAVAMLVFAISNGNHARMEALAEARA
jgi:AAHS family benzoate transporter-like MFS transporter